MDRHPQQIKRERQDVKRRARNVSSMSRLRTQIKRVLESTDKEKAQAEYTVAVSYIAVSYTHLTLPTKWTV